MLFRLALLFGFSFCVVRKDLVIASTVVWLFNQLLYICKDLVAGN